MRKRQNIFSKILFILMFLLLITSGIGFKYYFMEPIEVEKISYIDDYKTINVQFSTDIVLDEKTKNNIKVLDSSGNSVALSYSLVSDSENLVIKPAESNYNLGEKYTFQVNDVQGRYFGKLNEQLKTEFLIDKLPIEQSLGLGKYMTEKVSNDKEYDWYVDQANTGKYSSTNCGPASAEMLGKWADENFQGYAEEARNLHYGDDGGWFTEDVQNYLKSYGIESKMHLNVTKEFIISQLDKGNIMLLGIKSGEISINEDSYEEHVDRFYWGSSGHFIIVKGYIVVDDKMYFEVYDPNSWNETYSDGTYKGKDRYYKEEEVIRASKVWYDKLLIIEKN